MTDLDAAINLIRQTLQESTVTKRSWILFQDVGLRVEWVNIWDDSPSTATVHLADRYATILLGERHGAFAKRQTKLRLIAASAVFRIPIASEYDYVPRWPLPGWGMVWLPIGRFKRQTRQRRLPQRFFVHAMLFRFAHSQVYPADQGVPSGERAWAMLSVMIGLSMTSLDTAIANTALPTIARALGTTESLSVWVVSSYQLAMAAGLLPLAGLGEIVGHRRVIMLGLLLFTVSSLICGLAPTLPWLVAARVMQGLGGSAMMSVNAAMVRFIFPSSQMGRGAGINALVVGISFASGPTIASLILSVLSWHWLFWVNLPTGILALVMGLRALPATPRSRRNYDHVAAVLCSLFFASLIFTLNDAAHASGWIRVGSAVALTLILLLWLLRRQSGSDAPVLAVDLLRLPLFALSTATAICSFATQGLAFVSLPFLMQHSLGYSQIETGYLITPWSVVVAVMAPVAGRLSDKHSPGLLGGIGLFMLCAGMVSLGLLPERPTVPDILWRMALCGAGFGFFQSPNIRAMMASAPSARSGGASGMVGTARLLGQSTGAALVAACLHVSTVNGAMAALWLGAIFAGLGSLASFMRLQYR